MLWRTLQCACLVLHLDAARAVSTYATFEEAKKSNENFSWYGQDMGVGGDPRDPEDTISSGCKIMVDDDPTTAEVRAEEPRHVDSTTEVTTHEPRHVDCTTTQHSSHDVRTTELRHDCGTELKTPQPLQATSPAATMHNADKEVRVFPPPTNQKTYIKIDNEQVANLTEYAWSWWADFNTPRVRMYPNVEIKNYPQSADESVLAIVEKIAHQLQVPGGVESIVAASRNNKSFFHPQPIIALISSYNALDLWIASSRARKQLMASEVDDSLPKTRIYINEYLSPYQKRLLLDVKKFAKIHNYMFVWITRGEIYLRLKTNTQAIRISRTSDLNYLVSDLTQ